MAGPPASPEVSSAMTSDEPPSRKRAEPPVSNPGEVTKHEQRHQKEPDRNSRIGHPQRKLRRAQGYFLLVDSDNTLDGRNNQEKTITDRKNLGKEV